MTRPSTACTHVPCRRVTRDASGRCHDHRGHRSASGSSGLSTPALPWIPGTVHPTGGYDEIVKDEFATRYLADEVPHREDGPAAIEHYSDGKKNSEEWYRRGVVHREDGPAYLGWHANGQQAEASYFVNGEISRANGPSTVLYRKNGVIEIEEWRTAGKHHRLDGPAVTSFTQLGLPLSNAFYVGGVEVEEGDLPLIREALDSGAPMEWALAYALGRGEE